MVNIWIFEKNIVPLRAEKHQKRKLNKKNKQ